MNQQIRTKEDKRYLLAASASNGRLKMYGQTLEEVCLLHENSIRNTKSPQLKAVERARYVEFMMCHIHEFERYIYHEKLERVISLCDCAISTLSETANGERMPYYADTISGLIKIRKSAIILLEE